MNERIKQVYDYLLENRLIYSQADFARCIKLNTGTTSEMLKGKSGVSQKTLDKLCEKFPMISYSWMLTGEGSMIKQDMTMKDDSVKVHLENIGNVTMEQPTQNAAPTAAAGSSDARIAALEAENARLKEEVNWLRSLINKQ